MASAFASPPPTPAWPAASFAPSRAPVPTPETPDDPSPRSRPGVLPHPADRPPQGLRRPLRAGHHRLRTGPHLRSPVPLLQPTSRPPQDPLLGSRRWAGHLVQAAGDGLVPDPRRPGSGHGDRDDRHPIGANPLRHRPGLGAATQTVPTTRASGRKSAARPLKYGVLIL